MKSYNKNMLISSILKTKQLLSIEIFPSKTLIGHLNLGESLYRYKKLNPDFISVTYGAGGHTKVNTFDIASYIKSHHNFNTMVHYTCIGSNKKEVEHGIQVLTDNKIDNFLALRGDMPITSENHKLDLQNSYFKYSSDLIQFIRDKRPEASIGCAGYPEKHFEAKNLREDVFNLKKKINAGADFVITQMFFDNNYYFDFLEKIKKEQIDVPILPGIVPIFNFDQIISFAKKCDVKIPAKLSTKMRKFKNNSSDMHKVGVEYALEQCQELLKNGVPGIHLYSLNKSEAVESLASNLSFKIYD